MLTTIPDGVVCYLDATIFYYHLVNAPPLSDDCSDLLTRIERARVQGVTSEHNGDLYACDHFVEPKYLLGNIQDTHLIELVASPQ